MRDGGRQTAAGVRGPVLIGSAVYRGASYGGRCRISPRAKPAALIVLRWVGGRASLAGAFFIPPNHTPRDGPVRPEIRARFKHLAAR